ncbi:MAG: hypothetical protein EA338_08325 [Roseinatronobacter sp.]|jgi:hypothetical protein|uniref:hypothetical protein n=1 Tax=Roseinatronobacter monicus TaxID=393481 RepID=UPI0012C7F2F3|nr:MAG: hypothetical protein EA338_08325 [Roseinatronobacter sp.]
MMQARSLPRLFVMYFISFVAGLALAWLILSRVSEGLREGQWLLMLLPPLGGMAVFHGVFPLLSRIRLGLEFIAVAGALVYGLGTVLTGAVWLGWLDAGTALMFWLAGVFGPGWWLMSQWAEKIGYFK